MRDDASLVAAYRNGEHAAFEELYARHLRSVYGAVYTRTHHRETAEDIVSQTFLKALQSIDSFDPSRGSFGAWLHRIARNLTIDHFRSLRPSTPVEDAWDLADDADTQRDASMAMLSETIGAHLRKLKPQQREIVLLRVWQGLPFADIAAITGMTEAACKMSFGRSLKTLRTFFLFLLSFFSFFHGFAS